MWFIAIVLVAFFGGLILFSIAAIPPTLSIPLAALIAAGVVFVELGRRRRRGESVARHRQEAQGVEFSERDKQTLTTE